jgi:hypothetical protein
MNEIRQEQINSTLRHFTELTRPNLLDIAGLARTSFVADLYKPSAIEEAAKNLSVSSQLEKAVNQFGISSQLLRTVENFGLASELKETVGKLCIASQLQDIASAMSGTKLLAGENLVSKQILNSISEQYNFTSKSMLEALKPQIDIYLHWANIHKETLSSLSRFWQDFEFAYQIAEAKAVQVLKKYNWFVSPSLPSEFVYQTVKIGRKRGNQRKAINKLFVDYFREDNYSNLLEMIEGWAENGLSQYRVKKLKGCVSILRNRQRGMNPCDYVMPVVISQIDGLKTEYPRKKGLTFSLKCCFRKPILECP